MVQLFRVLILIFDANYTLPTTNGWTVTDGKLVLPASATKNDANINLTDNTQFSVDNYAYVFNSGNKESNCRSGSQDTPCYSYYSWDVATLGSGRSIGADNTDASYSICPKNWKLPTSRYTSPFNATVAEDSDYYNLAISHEMPTGAWSKDSGNHFYNEAGPGTQPDFLRVGYYGSGSFVAVSGRRYGNYWSATSGSSSSSARSLYFYINSVNTASSFNRKNGLSVRCLFKAN